MKKALLSFLIAGSLIACNNFTSSTADKKIDSVVNKIEDQTDSLKHKVQVNADTLKNQLERKGDSAKAKVEAKMDKMDSAHKSKK